MMFRSWMIFAVAQECRKAEGKKDSVNFLLEHPSAPEEMPEVVSIWKTLSWKQLKNNNLVVCEVDQGDLGSGATKPTMGNQPEAGISQGWGSCEEEKKDRRKNKGGDSAGVTKVGKVDSNNDELHR